MRRAEAWAHDEPPELGEKPDERTRGEFWRATSGEMKGLLQEHGLAAAREAQSCFLPLVLILTRLLARHTHANIGHSLC